MSRIENVISPKEKNLGNEFFVRRALPSMKKKMVGPFIFWDHMGPVELKRGVGMNVRSHPHIGLSTITYLFSGEIIHRDSLGNELPIRPGEVNWMTAGRGITHSERTDDSAIGQILEGIQLWVALPKEHEACEPNFSHFKEETLPLTSQYGLSMRLIAGEYADFKSPLPVYSPLFYLIADKVSPGAYELPIPSDQEGALYVVSGKIRVEGMEMNRFDLGVYAKGEGICFTVLEEAKLMFFGGQVFPEERHLWWNFVSSSKSSIEKAKKDWVGGRFPKTVNELEYSEMPE